MSPAPAVGIDPHPLLDDEKKHHTFRKLRGALKKANLRGARAILKKIPNCNDLKYIVSTTDYDSDEALDKMIKRLIALRRREKREWKIVQNQKRDQGFVLPIEDLDKTCALNLAIKNLLGISKLIAAAKKGKYPKDVITR